MTVLIDLPFPIKLLIAVIVDLLDFTVFRFPPLDSFWDVIAALIAIALIGPLGLVALAELGDASGQIDAQIPSVTILVLLNFLIFRT